MDQTTPDIVLVFLYFFFELLTRLVMRLSKPDDIYSIKDPCLQFLPS